jgi:DDE superfamily endonuclease
LTEEQKKRNKAVSRERIFVEHAIGGMKKFRILKNKFRLKSDVLKNKILGICAGLWNYQLLLKHT